MILAAGVVVPGRATHLRLNDDYEAVAQAELLGTHHHVVDALQEQRNEAHLVDVIGVVTVEVAQLEGRADPQTRTECGERDFHLLVEVVIGPLRGNMGHDPLETLRRHLGFVDETARPSNAGQGVSVGIGIRQRLLDACRHTLMVKSAWRRPPQALPRPPRWRRQRWAPRFGAWAHHSR